MRVLDRNFGTYTLPRFFWVPKVETVILDSSDTPAQGGAKPTIASGNPAHGVTRAVQADE